MEPQTGGLVEDTPRSSRRRPRARGSLAGRSTSHGLQRLDAAGLARGSRRARAVLLARERELPPADLARRRPGRRRPSSSSSRRSTSLTSTTGPCRSARTSRRSWASRATTRQGRGRSVRRQHLRDPAHAPVRRLGSSREVDRRDRPHAHAPPPRAGRAAHDRAVLLPLPAAPAARVGDVRERRLRAQPRLSDDQPARHEGEHGGLRRGGRPRAPAVRPPPRHLFSTYLGGIAAGLGFYAYHPGRAAFVLWAVFLGLLALLYRRQVPLRRIATFGAAALAGFVIDGRAAPDSPSGKRRRPRREVDPTAQLLITKRGREFQRDWVLADTILDGYLKNVKFGLTTFNNKVTDHGYIYVNQGHGFVDPLTGILVWVGVGFVALGLILRRRRERAVAAAHAQQLHRAVARVRVPGQPGAQVPTTPDHPSVRRLPRHRGGAVRRASGGTAARPLRPAARSCFRAWRSRPPFSLRSAPGTSRSPGTTSTEGARKESRSAAPGGTSRRPARPAVLPRRRRERALSVLLVGNRRSGGTTGSLGSPPRRSSPTRSVGRGRHRCNRSLRSRC